MGSLIVDRVCALVGDVLRKLAGDGSIGAMRCGRGTCRVSRAGGKMSCYQILFRRQLDAAALS